MNEVILFFDTETTGKANFKLPPESSEQPDLVQIAAMLWEVETGTIWASLNAVIHPYVNGDITKERRFQTTKEALEIHKISDELAIKFGQPNRTVLSVFNYMCRSASTIVAHNIAFDYSIMRTAYHREGVPHRMDGIKHVCTMKAATPVLKLPKPAGWRGPVRPEDKYKWPTLTECYEHFFKTKFTGAHNAMNDVMAMMHVWGELRKIGAL